MKKLLYAILALALMTTSCEWLEENVDTSVPDDDIVEGLITALEVGTDSSTTILSAVNGYYGDALVKIPLPQEAQAVRDMINSNSTLANISELIGLEGLFEDLILSVNRAAEDAASEAAPIFSSTINNLSISDGLEILNGQVPTNSNILLKSTNFDSTAATQYLINETYVPLTGAFAPKINASLGKKIAGNVSAVDVWESLTTKYNSFVNRNDVSLAIAAAKLLGSNINLPSSINDDLGEFSTQKALDGLFYKVGETEKHIRRDPWVWISSTVGDILTKIFG